MERISKDQVQQITMDSATFARIARPIYARMFVSDAGMDVEEYGTGIIIYLNGIGILFREMDYEGQVEIKLKSGYRFELIAEVLNDILEVPFLQMIGG